MEFHVGGDIFQVSSGGSVFAPRMLPHTFQNVGQKDAKILALAVPSGRMEAFVADLEALVAQGTSGLDSAKAVFEKYDFELVGPPLAGWPQPR